MTMSPLPPAGSHQLGSAFGGVSEPAQGAPGKTRRRHTKLIFTALGVIVLAAVCAGVQWGANVGYDAALESFDDAAADAESSQAELAEVLTGLIETSETATIIQDADTGNLMDAASRDAFDAAVGEATEAEETATELAEDQVPAADEKPGWPWELFGETAQLNEDRDHASEQRSAFDSSRDDLSAAATAVEEAGMTAVQSAADAADAFEADHVSARNLDIISLRTAAEWLSDATLLDTSTADAYVDLELAAVDMLSSEQEEIAEKQGALHQARIEVEAFARELAPDVLLDFDWSPIVNGYGEGSSMAGYATWWYSDPGYANIELTDSVAQEWPNDRSRALVAHEVGHAISVKCEGMYDDSNQETIEAWATAWAISMGYHDVANGTSAYGAPPQSLIDAAAGCR
ncbi:hypothetical protein [Microbacterium sp.]|uniref:hypothetical protein n=1 Tax=Microbacterium sp. TaxID=51671 RepID=UPI003F9C21F9